MTTKISLPPTTIPSGSWILITGITGYIASHISLEFLDRSYRVRGTTRDVSKASWLKTSLFKSQTEAGFFEVASVPDLAAPGVFDQAMKGVSAVLHVATISSYDGDPNNAITPTEAVDLAWQEPYGPQKGYITYVASKIVTEKAVWKFVEEEKPDFELNVVCPFTNIGKVLDKAQAPELRTLMSGFVGAGEQVKAMLAILPNMAYINTRDDAIIQVGAVLDPDVKNERIFAWAQKFNWNDVLAIMRKVYPDKEIIEDLPNPKMFMGEADMSLALSLLRKWGPQDGWTSFEQGVREILENVKF
ncbi:NAD(P)-binding protein [Acephala macrosclerotiorum]|nr:NAD(P)-binding protein [Acephala macrosclerotiorum]